MRKIISYLILLWRNIRQFKILHNIRRNILSKGGCYQAYTSSLSLLSKGRFISQSQHLILPTYKPYIYTWYWHTHTHRYSERDKIISYNKLLTWTKKENKMKRLTSILVLVPLLLLWSPSFSVMVFFLIFLFHNIYNHLCISTHMYIYVCACVCIQFKIQDIHLDLCEAWILIIGLHRSNYS